LQEPILETSNMTGMNFRSRNGVKALVALAGIVVGIAAERSLAASPSTATEAESRPQIEVVRPRRLTVAQRLQTNATLEAFEQTDLFAKVSGYLSDVRVDIGDHVKAGQILAVIEVPETEKELAENEAQREVRRKTLEAMRQQVEHNKADLALQEVTFKRQSSLNKDRWVSDQALDEIHAKAGIAKADLAVAEANRDLAGAQVDLATATVEKTKTLLAYAQIVAPFDGVVARRLVNRGDLVQAATSTRTTPLFTVQRIDIVRVFCDVPQNELPHLRIADPAIVKPLGFSGKPFMGKITRFSLRLDPETRNMRTEIDLPNAEERLYPGMYAEVSLEMNRRPDALTVPVAAVGSDSEGDFVYSIADNRITRLAIKTGLTDNGRIEVIAGLSDETPVVAAVRSSPPPGTAVQPLVRESS
jgi:RND family efflux transporter MFP subunit